MEQKILRLCRGIYPKSITLYTSSAADSGGERQGHCMKHEAVMSTLVKWLLSLQTDEVAARDAREKDTICHQKGPELMEQIIW